MNHTFPDPTAPMAAVKQVWQNNAELVQRLQLEATPGGAIGPTGSSPGSYFVMVYCGNEDVSAHELVDVLRMLEQQVEREFGQSVSLMLTNEPDESKAVNLGTEE